LKRKKIRHRAENVENAEKKVVIIIIQNINTVGTGPCACPIKTKTPNTNIDGVRRT